MRAFHASAALGGHEPAAALAPRHRSTHESLPDLHLHAQGSARRRRDRQPPADDARRHDQAPGRRHLQLHAAGPARDPQGRGHHPRGDEPRRRHRTADAGGAAGRAVAGDRPLPGLRARADAREGPARPRLHHPAHQRRGHHRHRAPGTAQLQAAAAKFLSHPDQVPRRAPAALRRDARARVHDEGRLFLRPRPGLGAEELRGHVRAYKRIFDRFGLQYRAVAADTGAIGGDASHEFQVIADTGEDAIVYCPTSDYAANIELAEACRCWPRARAGQQPMAKTPTPGKSTCEDVAAAGPAAGADRQVAGAGHRREERGRRHRQDHRVAAAGARRPQPQRGQGRQGAKAEGGFRFATVAEIEDHFGCKPGYLGPMGTKKPVKVVADRTVAR
jgi:hypothetical protein